MLKNWTHEQVGEAVAECAHGVVALLDERGEAYGVEMLGIFGKEYTLVNLVSKALRAWNLSTNGPNTTGARNMLLDSITDLVGYGLLWMAVNRLEARDDDS